MPWIVEIGDEFLPEFNELDEPVRTRACFSNSGRN
jgi:hypothetical protein